MALIYNISNDYIELCLLDFAQFGLFRYDQSYFSPQIKY